MQVLGLVLGTLLSTLVLLEIGQVLMRYFFASGISWGRDIATLLLFAIAWMGAPLVWLRSAHITVDMFPNTVAGRSKMRLVVNLAMIAFAVVLCRFTLDAIEVFSQLDLASLGVSSAVKFYPVITGMGLLIIAAAINILIDFYGGETKDD